jgi:hypothetical protein
VVVRVRTVELGKASKVTVTGQQSAGGGVSAKAAAGPLAAAKRASTATGGR